ncbi:MAG: HD-GYP domain-containing protein [Vicinamibacterales bacterium]
MTAPRLQLADELLRRLVASLRSAQLYSKNHPIIARNLESLSAAAQLLHSLDSTIVVGLVGDEVIVDDMPVAKAETLGPLVGRLQQGGIQRIIIDRGVTVDEFRAFIEAVTAADAAREGGEMAASFPTLPHIRVGRVTIEERVESDLSDMATIKRMYNEAVSAASSVWDSAQTEGQPDATMAKTMIDGLAQAVAQNRTALLALTTLKNYDNYTFTHMVNVSILTMGQARGLGIDGALLREFGLAALMHDIGKVRTPLEILNKPEKLTDTEFAIMKRHTVDGAEMLRQTPDLPALAPVVAFEHHLRLDGSGYPHGVKRASLNVGTMLCSIADVYDAMRSQRGYQQAFPTDRILEVLKRNDGRQFDQHLVRRFTQLIGIYPVGNLVRLNTGETAVVLKVYAPDPHRPQVRVLYGRDGQRLDLTYDLNLWEPSEDPQRPSSVVRPLDPAEFGIDPLMLL